FSVRFGGGVGAGGQKDSGKEEDKQFIHTTPTREGPGSQTPRPGLAVYDTFAMGLWLKRRNNDQGYSVLDLYGSHWTEKQSGCLLCEAG
ncbi:MAG: hypothetical protein P1V20_25280, partial [Verrucomicrobiales bacterium]|nr:hypothetical protein [Verrucomicrobiales bacterium]